MKFSSVSLIAAALAGIAGNAVAAPLHAHALEAVNSFEERDLDVYSALALLERKVDDDSLFTRADISPEEIARLSEGARLSRKANQKAKHAHIAAIMDNRRAYEETGDVAFKLETHKLLPDARYHHSLVLQHERDRKAIARNRATPSQIKRSGDHEANVRSAEASEKSAKESSRTALTAIENHEAAQVHEAAQILHEAPQVEAARILHDMKAGRKGR